MEDMFNGSHQFNGDISQWDVSNVTNMDSMFGYSKKFNGDISQWDVSNVTNMEEMFLFSQFNGDISQWDVSKVTNMNRMFWYETTSLNSFPFNGDISQWDVNDVTFKTIVGQEITRLGYKADLNHIDVSKVTNMEDMFSGSHQVTGSQFNGDISQWDVSNVTNMRQMFLSSHFNGDISKWDVSKVTNMDIMFYDSKFNGDISQWDVSNVTNMDSMLNVSSFEGDTSSWLSKLPTSNKSRDKIAFNRNDLKAPAQKRHKKTIYNCRNIDEVLEEQLPTLFLPGAVLKLVIQGINIKSALNKTNDFKIHNLQWYLPWDPLGQCKIWTRPCDVKWMPRQDNYGCPILNIHHKQSLPGVFGG
jgi:surface protein